MKELLKGGLVCLLSFLSALTLFAQNSFTIQSDPNSDDLGLVTSPRLDKETIQILEESELTFSEWVSFFDIRILGASRSVLGSYSLASDYILFKPRFLPDPNVTYQITFLSSKLEEIVDVKVPFNDIEETISFNTLMDEGTEIIGISPSSSTVPANTLRFYIYFSNPMGFQNPYDFIKLFNGKGEEVIDPFVELPEGLWNENRTRLTVLFHPGRVKRGVEPNLSQGAILLEGKKYSLNISNEWLDANANQIETSHGGRDRSSGRLCSREQSV
ncbi:MAG: hypothetical protein AAF391_11850 [Bacteroidota bacterium]